MGQKEAVKEKDKVKGNKGKYESKRKMSRSDIHRETMKRKRMGKETMEKEAK